MDLILVGVQPKPWHGHPLKLPFGISVFDVTLATSV